MITAEPDQTIECRDCGAAFTWTAGEQEFFHQKGLMHPPRRCPPCRALKRQQRFGPRQLHEAVCGECGGKAMVPFVPRQQRPVLCADCFQRTSAAEA